MEELIGPKIIATGLIALRPKVPQDKRTTVLWHQDSHYFGRDSSEKRIITVWIPLVDTDKKNGCMQIIPKSHSWGYVEADYIPGFHARSRSNPDGIDTWQTWHRRYKDSGITTE